jgi:hypothetical protein
MGATDSGIDSHRESTVVEHTKTRGRRKINMKRRRPLTGSLSAPRVKTNTSPSSLPPQTTLSVLARTVVAEARGRTLVMEGLRGALEEMSWVLIYRG